MHKDGISRTETKVALAPVVLAADTTTTSVTIDTRGYESLVLSVVAGIVSAGDVVISAVSESADSGMSGSTAVPAARLIGTLAATAADTTNDVASVGVVANLRYVNCVLTSDNSCNMLISIIAKLGNAVIATD
jgi:hypothetical protein